MTVTAEPTPNPNALKFTVGQDVGGPKTYVAAGDIDDPTARALLDIEGVTSVFMTADFVTISKTAGQRLGRDHPASDADSHRSIRGLGGC